MNKEKWWNGIYQGKIEVLGKICPSATQTVTDPTQIKTVRE
jgi:hypothetical protein